MLTIGLCPVSKSAIEQKRCGVEAMLQSLWNGLGGSNRVQLSHWRMCRALGGWDVSHPSDARTIIGHLHFAIGRQRHVLALERN